MTTIGRTDAGAWWRGGDVPLLLVQPLNAAMAPVDSGRAVAQVLGGRAIHVEIDHCGHTILPAQTPLVIGRLIQFLRHQAALTG